MANLYINIQKGWALDIKVGDQLDYASVIATAKSKSQEPIMIPIASILEFNPSQIFKHLKKQPGEEVKKGEVLASKESLFSTKKYLSDVDGTITDVSHISGELTLTPNIHATTFEKVESLVQGEVSKIEETTITIKVGKVASAKPKKPIKKRCGGRIVIVSDVNLQTLTSTQVKDTIAVLDKVQSYASSKLDALGAIGFVATSQIESDLPQIVISNDELQKIINSNMTSIYANPADTEVVFYN